MQPWLVGLIGNDGDQLRLLGKVARVGVVVVVGGGGSGGHPVAVGVVGPAPAEPETVVEAGGSEGGVEASAEKNEFIIPNQEQGFFVFAARWLLVA